LVEEYEMRSQHANSEDAETMAEHRQARQRLRLVAIDAGRAKLREHTEQVESSTHLALLEELDLQEQQIRNALGEEATGESTS
ncbi:MAG TPA: hypothetical protein VET87_20740, partial [Rubrivivax sp.]|nr:hypothetical protein [Rubrivivax sp.]